MTSNETSNDKSWVPGHLKFGRYSNLLKSGLSDDDIETLVKLKYSCEWDGCPCGDLQ